MRHAHRITFAAAVTAFSLASCAAPEHSVTLLLSLKPGMERTMKFTTEQQIESTVPEAGGAQTAKPTTTSLSFTYHFKVTSLGGSGLAKMEVNIVDANASKGLPLADPSLRSLRNLHLTATVDAAGHLLDLTSDVAGRVSLPGFPQAPGSKGQGSPAAGDMGTLFGGLNGQKVTIGDTWTSSLSPSVSSGLKGSLRWTLSAIRGSSVRLDYTGTLDPQDVPLAGLPADEHGTLSGDASGFVELERGTGWPTRGQSVLRAAITLSRPGGPSSGTGAGTAMVNMRITSSYDAVK